ncbi:hypothetical protein GH984_05310 [Spiribacter sp. C176]|uniref:Uncharacterized protein n=1 Tax=Spiribacter salilacus TaxID=2664894 RepID=A0A6N7QRT8_9GAMM|nr:hypothetical protein [Spiribacter salilacus]MRH78119.1 hypothetical protein [Spiribacter salilacus]
MIVPDHERHHRAFLAAAQLRYPWQFRNRARNEVAEPVVVEVGRGWHPLLERLFADVERLVPESQRGIFRWQRLRANQGALEIRFEGGKDHVLPAILRARDAAAVCCEHCGAPGQRLEVAGQHAVSCPKAFFERLLAVHPADPAGVRRWLSSQPDAQTDHPSPALIESALREVMPPLPMLNGAHRQRLQGAWPILRADFGERLRSLRIAEFDPASGSGGSLIAVMSVTCDEAAHATAVNHLARAGFSDLRLRLVSLADLEQPALANEPWACMLALEASVTIPRYQPGI